MVWAAESKGGQDSTEILHSNQERTDCLKIYEQTTHCIYLQSPKGQPTRQLDKQCS